MISQPLPQSDVDQLVLAAYTAWVDATFPRIAVRTNIPSFGPDSTTVRQRRKMSTGDQNMTNEEKEKRKTRLLLELARLIPAHA